MGNDKDLGFINISAEAFMAEHGTVDAGEAFEKHLSGLCRILGQTGRFNVSVVCHSPELGARVFSSLDNDASEIEKETIRKEAIEACEGEWEYQHSARHSASH